MNIITLAALVITLANKLECHNTVERHIDHKTMVYLTEAVYSLTHGVVGQVAYNRKQAMKLHGKGLKLTLVKLLTTLQKAEVHLGAV